MTGCSAQPATSLYVHVPFCAHKCEYCAFYSETPAGDTVDLGTVKFEAVRVKK